MEVNYFTAIPKDKGKQDRKNKATAHIKLENHQGKFNIAMLPDSITLANGYQIIRPAKWK